MALSFCFDRRMHPLQSMHSHNLCLSPDGHRIGSGTASGLRVPGHLWSDPGSTHSSESFAQVTDKMRLADVPSEILNVPTINGCFAQERTVTKNAAMSELLT